MLVALQALVAALELVLFSDFSFSLSLSLFLSLQASAIDFKLVIKLTR